MQDQGQRCPSELASVLDNICHQELRPGSTKGAFPFASLFVVRSEFLSIGSCS